MKIYTKTGDQGETSLYGPQRVKKNHPKIKSVGALDETMSAIGVVRSYEPLPEIDTLLKKIQDTLFTVGNQIASVKAPEQTEKIQETHINWIEEKIDNIQLKLDPLQNFILPGGTKVAARIHHARTICRRTEIQIYELSTIETLDPLILKYLNRLSDLLFVLARYANKLENKEEVIWAPNN